MPQQTKVLFALQAHEDAWRMADVEGRHADREYHAECIERLKKEAREHARRAQR